MNNEMITVKNRSAGMVVYRIPEDGIRRPFQPGETKKIAYSELEKLTYQPGGRTLLENFLQIIEENAIQDFVGETENEYFMSEEQVVDLLQNGSLDAFLDCLDYAPLGVIDLIKAFAISLPLNDIPKRTALKEKTGFDVTVALENMRKEQQVDETNKVETTTTTTSKRRTTTNYKVVNKTATEETKEAEKTE